MKTKDNTARERMKRRKLLGRHIRRKLHRFDTVVAVTGSAGKSSTCRLVGAILDTRGPTLKQYVANGADEMVLAFRPRRGDRNWVQEVSGSDRVAMRRALAFVRPQIGVVTCVGDDHIDSYGSRDRIAEAKRQLVECLPETGAAILNADDGRVAAMAGYTKAETITFGVENPADIRATEVSAGLNEGLRMTVTDGTASVGVHAQFVSICWAQSVLAALACGKALGIPLAVCAEAVGRVEPEPYKESVHRRDGVTVVLNLQKAAGWTIPASLETVSRATAARKVFVLGTIRYAVDGDIGAAYRNATRAALAICDRVIVCGGGSAWVRDLVPEHDGRLSVHDDFEALAKDLGDDIRPGDLVYVKSAIADRMQRLLDVFENRIS